MFGLPTSLLVDEEKKMDSEEDSRQPSSKRTLAKVHEKWCDSTRMTVAEFGLSDV